MGDTTAIITTKVAEKSTVTFTAAFTDENDAAATPDSIVWSLSDEDGTIINSREDVAATSGTSTVDITLSGDDLALPNRNKLKRKLTIEAIVDLDVGDNKPVNGELTFYIEDLTNISS